MLDCKRNRLDYGELLKPPEGYRLDRAVAATYSADLGTLLSIPVALVYAQTMEGDISGARFQLLDAIKQFSSRVKIYHQKGKLHKPAKLNWLYAHLEDALAPILPADAFASFHPKLWVIRYTRAEDSSPDLPNCFRVIVLSRNLTFDRSWDVAACIDGKPSVSPRKVNQPLVDFVRWLDHQGPTTWGSEFVAELSRVNFIPPAPFDRVAFHAIGTPGARPNPTTTRTGTTCLVMSPFLHPDALAWLRKNTGELFLFSNRDELECLPSGSLEDVRCHHLSDLVIDGEFQDGATEGPVEPMHQKLHAKLFIFDEEQGASWFLGSANATKAAAVKNVEFMLELSGGGPATRVRPQINTLLGKNGMTGAFVEFDSSMAGQTDEADAARQRNFRRFEYALLASPISGRATPAPNGLGFDLTFDFDLTELRGVSGIKATAQPFNVRAAPTPFSLRPGHRQTCVFSNISEVELSRFLLFHLHAEDDQSQEFLLRIEIEGLPENRLDSILRKIIDSRDKFFDYLQFLLAEEIHKEDLVGGETPAKGTPEDADSDWQAKLPIFEQLLITASRSPRKLKDIDEVIRHLATKDSSPDGASIVPPDFIPFWEAFRSLIPEKPEGMP